MKEQELIPHLFRTEYRKIVVVLCKLFGTQHIENVEDIVSDTFLQAAETWGMKGLPDNPTGWLYTVSKNKALDYLRRNKLFTQKIAPEIMRSEETSHEIDIDLSNKNINDSQLQMMFAVCHPCITTEAQIGLSLNLLCGFGAEEIADAFLSNKDTIYKRLIRAKEKLRKEQVKIELPDEKEINIRLETVLTTLYLLFNEGYYSSTQNTTLRKELCLEAMRLNYLLIENSSTNKPAVNALMSLMCFHSSRFEARMNEAGETILYDEQNRDLWNDELISKGNHFLIKSAEGQEVTKYHIEASIAYWHCTKIETPQKWENVLHLYDQLLQIDNSPIVAINRIYALSKAKGKHAAIVEAVELPQPHNRLYCMLLGNLYTDIDNQKATEYYKAAMRLTKTANDKSTIEKHIKKIAD